MMVDTMAALIPVFLAGWFFFGWAALKVVIICAAAAFVAELLWQKALGLPIRIYDGSAVLTGILLGLLLSTEVPWWIPVLGAVVAIVLGKQVFGGLGNHPFNAALVGWTFLQISYKETLSSIPTPVPRFFLEEGMSFSEEAEILMETPMATLVEDFDLIADASWLDLFLGNVPGTIGTISVLAVLLGGAYLIFRRIITWHIPLSFILSAWGFALIFWLIDAEVYAPPTFHVLSGWIMLGAFFLAPEKGTAPVTVPGMILYGMGCGVVTMIIRIWGVHLEGVPFAILLMNALTPLLDRIRPRAVGRVGEIA
jgi:electron transport complex protein RnfD